MVVSGFTFIRNAVVFDYPVVESIQSVLPIVDEMVVAVGQSDDDTLNLIKSIGSDKVKIIQTVWDESLRSGGRVLAAETDKAYAAVRPDADWCIYLQADEVIHEKYHHKILESMARWKDDLRVDGLLFDYVHFFGSYDYIATSSSWYRHEIRVIRKNKNIYSYRDAQGFRKENNLKLSVKDSGANIYHYGWVKPPTSMQKKQESFHKWWHSDEWVKNNVAAAAEFDYNVIDILQKFSGSHPIVMQDRISRLNWHFERDISKNKVPLKEKLKSFMSKYLGLDFSYRNFIRI